MPPDNTTTARGTYINQYMAIYIPIIRSHPEWQNLAPTSGTTVASSVADLETRLSGLGGQIARLEEQRQSCSREATEAKNEGWDRCFLVHGGRALGIWGMGR